MACPLRVECYQISRLFEELAKHTIASTTLSIRSERLLGVTQLLTASESMNCAIMPKQNPTSREIEYRLASRQAMFVRPRCEQTLEGALLLCASSCNSIQYPLLQLSYRILLFRASGDVPLAPCLLASFFRLSSLSVLFWPSTAMLILAHTKTISPTICKEYMGTHQLRLSSRTLKFGRLSSMFPFGITVQSLQKALRTY